MAAGQAWRGFTTTGLVGRRGGGLQACQRGCCPVAPDLTMHAACLLCKAKAKKRQGNPQKPKLCYHAKLRGKLHLFSRKEGLSQGWPSQEALLSIFPINRTFFLSVSLGFSLAFFHLLFTLSLSLSPFFFFLVFSLLMFYSLFLCLFIGRIIRHMQQDSMKERHRRNKNKEDTDTK